jgi:hypothetical protein
MVAGFASCSKLEDPREGLSLEDIISLDYDDGDKELLADESDRIFIYADLDSVNVSPNMNVTYTTEQGSFVGGDQETDYKTITVRADGYRSKVILKGDNEVNGRVGISAKIGEYTIYDEVSFVRSYPEQVLNTASKLTLTPDLSDKIYIDVDLVKTTGVVSNETRVDFEVIVTEGTPSVLIQPLFWTPSNNRAELMTTSMDTGKIYVVPYVLDGTTYIGSIDTLEVFIDD